jgi:protein BCP1
MYRMLADEIRWACDDGEPYHFGYFLVLSRTYTLSDEEGEAMSTSSQQHKRRKGAQGTSAAGSVFTFHHEDELIQQVCHALPTPLLYSLKELNLIRKLASHSLDYTLSNTLPREKETFGLEQGGRLMLLPSANLGQLLLNLSATFTQPSA